MAQANIQTTSPTASTAYTQTGLDAVWLHLDRLVDEDGNQALTIAAESVQAVAHALRDSKPVHPDSMARLLDSAAKTIREAQRHVGDAIVELGDITYHQ